MNKFFKNFIISATIFVFTFGFSVNAQMINMDASRLIPRVGVSFSPRQGSFVEESTFEVPILLDTKGSSINGIEVRINFDKNKLTVIKPSSGKSIIGVWVEPPKYDNTKGTASYVGVVPDGITTSSGLIGTITFKALRTGNAVVNVSSNSSILLNDGLGTKATVDFGRAEYSLIPKAPEGVKVFSDTHPLQSEWYNNSSPVVFWEKDAGVEGFSYEFDHVPGTIPDNTIDTEETYRSYEDVTPGLWYFHIKAYKNGVWGSVGHFLIRIDVTPPAAFTPEVNHVLATPVFIEKALVSFSTTDDLSGINRYEVGVINKSQSTTVSPVFVQAESPFQVPMDGIKEARVIVRATDNAGNVRDSFLDIKPPVVIKEFIKNYLVYILLFVIVVGLITLILHYLFEHHILRTIKKFREFMKKEDKVQENNEGQNPPTSPNPNTPNQ